VIIGTSNASFQRTVLVSSQTPDRKPFYRWRFAATRENGGGKFTVPENGSVVQSATEEKPTATVFRLNDGTDSIGLPAPPSPLVRGSFHGNGKINPLLQISASEVGVRP
jgi:hypothetical protein